MKYIINNSELQREYLKGIYKAIDHYDQSFNVNQSYSKVIDDNPKLLLNIIKSIKNIKNVLLKEFGIKSIGIFGSYARGENTPDSDLDIVIDYKINDYKDFYKIETFLKKELHIDNLDLLTIDGISPFALDSLKDDVIYI